MACTASRLKIGIDKTTQIGGLCIWFCKMYMTVHESIDRYNFGRWLDRCYSKKMKPWLGGKQLSTPSKVLLEHCWRIWSCDYTVSWHVSNSDELAYTDCSLAIHAIGGIAKTMLKDWSCGYTVSWHVSTNDELAYTDCSLAIGNLRNKTEHLLRWVILQISCRLYGYEPVWAHGGFIWRERSLMGPWGLDSSKYSLFIDFSYIREVNT